MLIILASKNVFISVLFFLVHFLYIRKQSIIFMISDNIKRIYYYIYCLIDRILYPNIPHIRNQHKISCLGGLAEWSKAADLRSVGQCPREFEPRTLHFFLIFYLAKILIDFFSKESKELCIFISICIEGCGCTIISQKLI